MSARLFVLGRELERKSSMMFSLDTGTLLVEVSFEGGEWRATAWMNGRSMDVLASARYATAEMAVFWLDERLGEIAAALERAS